MTAQLSPAGGGAASLLTPADIDAVALIGRLAAAVEDCRHDPRAFVTLAFPWGQSGTPLARERGPYPWQARVLDEIGRALRRNAATGVHDVIRHAVATGHGAGKSALAAWVLLWGLATARDARLMLTASSEQHLRTRTWPELAKWHGLMLCRHWFTFTDTAIVARGREKTWRLDRVGWSERNTAAFQGLHNKGGRIVLAFDEAAAIADDVWAAAEGALTDAGTEIVWLALGNPARNAGRFRACFAAGTACWRTWRVDSRTVPGTNRRLFARWIRDYGADSDFVRVRVKGAFPRAVGSRFIAPDLVAAAARRPAAGRRGEPLVLGVDVARHGDDRSVIWARRGGDARTWPPVKLRIPDLMQVAACVARLARRLRADAIFVDLGMGAGVVDRLREMGVPNVRGVAFGGPADSPADGASSETAAGRYANKRAEMWAGMRAWLTHGTIPDDPEVRADLTGPGYGLNAEGEIQLERKRDMKRRGLASPDLGDALALTFAYPVARRARQAKAP